MVGDLLGNTLSLDIRKFITQTQDEFNVKVTGKADGLKHPQDMKQAIDRNFSSLMAAVAAVGEDDEPDEEELEEIEQQAVTVAAPTVKSDEGHAAESEERCGQAALVEYERHSLLREVQRHHRPAQVWRQSRPLRRRASTTCESIVALRVPGIPVLNLRESPSFRPEDEATAEAA